jgi:hypothetical protein
MRFYRAFEPGEQETLPYLDKNCLQQIILLLDALEQTSRLKMVYILFMAYLKRKPRQTAPSSGSAAKIISDSLDDEFEFAQENNWLFKCFLTKQKSELQFFPSFRPDHLTDEAWGWMQRSILVLRCNKEFWVFLPRQ